MISNIRFEMKNTSQWHQYLRKCTGSCEPALVMETDIFGSVYELLGTQTSSGTLTGKLVEPLRGFKDKTPWKPLRFVLCHAWPIGEIDPKDEILSGYKFGAWSCVINMIENAQRQREFQVEGSWDLSDWADRGWNSWWWRKKSFKTTDKMEEINDVLEAEMRTIVPVYFDPTWWWSFKYAEEMNRQDYWASQIEKSKKSSDKFELELTSRQLPVPM